MRIVVFTNDVTKDFPDLQNRRFVDLGEVENMLHHHLLLEIKRNKFEFCPYFVHKNEIQILPEEEV
jgi:hypothetical protein